MAGWQLRERLGFSETPKPVSKAPMKKQSNKQFYKRSPIRQKESQEAETRNSVYLKLNMENEITRNIRGTNGVATKEYAERTGKRQRILNFTKNMDMDAIMSC